MSRIKTDDHFRRRRYLRSASAIGFATFLLAGCYANLCNNLLVPWMSFDGLLDTAFEQIRHYAASDIAVSLRLMRAFTDIARATQYSDIRMALLERAQRVAAGCAGHLPKDDLVKLQ